MVCRNHWLIFNNVGNQVAQLDFFNEEQKMLVQEWIKLDYENCQIIEIYLSLMGGILGKISISGTLKHLVGCGS
jgi:hypothetical protein